MNRTKKMIRVLTCAAALAVAAAAGNASAAVNSKVASRVKEAVEQALLQKTLASGTLDLFDKDLDAVRNLQKINVGEEVTEADGVYSVLADYRDINTGAVVQLEAQAVPAGDAYELKDLLVKSVKELDQPGTDKTYSDGEIQDYMTDYFKKQGEFTDGKIMLFDEGKEKMRPLDLIELKSEVRRMGIFSNSTAEFRDVDTGELLNVDVSVENRDGRLAVKALRIRSVRPAPKKQ